MSEEAKTDVEMHKESDSKKGVDENKLALRNVVIYDLKELLEGIYLFKFVYANLDFGSGGDTDVKFKYESRHNISFN